jgi:6-phospho-beta-glucosidase
VLEPGRSRGGIHELELALDVLDAIVNDRGTVHPVNVPNSGGALPGFPEDLVVEVLGRCHGDGIDVLPARPLPRHVRGLVEMLGEYQALAADAAWRGTRVDGVRALSANPLVLNVDLAERLYDALAAAHRRYLPQRLLAA